jgi:hypothetical protein
MMVPERPLRWLASFADWGMTAFGTKVHAIYQGEPLCTGASICGEAEADKVPDADFCRRCLGLIARMHEVRLEP